MSLFHFKQRTDSLSNYILSVIPIEDEWGTPNKVRSVNEGPMPGEAAARNMNENVMDNQAIRFIVEGPLPPDLNIAIMTVLSFHINRRNPISHAQLCACLKDFRISDRFIRDRIKHLRRSGHLIGSVGGEAEYPECSSVESKDLENGGYYLITTPEDLDEFLKREYHSKIKDMQQTVESMIKCASQRWGPDSIQLKLL